METTMHSTAIKAVLIAALVGVGACTKKAEDLPPQPPSTTAPPATESESAAPSTGAVTSSAVPGSLADFVQQAGSDKVFFDTDRYDLDSAAQATLNGQAGWLNKYTNVRITIEGHADERGTREYNLALGERRANAVKNYLAGQGVSAERVNVISYGKERPAVEGSDESAWAQNRRAVTVLVGAAAS
jgi:peptidoglycan-associated lipoprotein